MPRFASCHAHSLPQAPRPRTVTVFINYSSVSALFFVLVFFAAVVFLAVVFFAVVFAAVFCSRLPGGLLLFFTLGSGCLFRSLCGLLGGCLCLLLGRLFLEGALILRDEFGHCSFMQKDLSGPLPLCLNMVLPQAGQKSLVGTSHVIKPQSVPRSQA